MTLLSASPRRMMAYDPPITGSSTPYAMPTAAPWNVDPAVTPTPDGTGQATHPSVVDFRYAWNGYRFWMAMTPYAGSNDTLENPAIVASNDGYTWHVPAGLTNPIAQWSGITGEYNSDTHLVWDGAKLICFWRAVTGSTARILAKTSANGVEWGATQEVIPSHALTTMLSPAVVRRAFEDWWMFAVDYSARKLSVRRASQPLGPWGEATLVAVPGNNDLWHVGALWDGAAFRLLACNLPLESSTIWALSSADGLNWSDSAPVIYGRAGMWDRGLYRATMTIMGDKFRTWYSATSGTGVAGDSWHIAYTQVPRSIWPNPPA